ncbi:MAG: polymer-forming cytoskeletal protein [Candidatus Xiphinematobacter sp.]|nr:MAG: polymer-forming cytoskeletal protein [Candidatus Xiphinematobacter sp.]QQY08873.1 MAG: polymer-forming cytoskeletal protein [Candidatus Xiphinematobacter sp.]QQY11088.1 MAG: polymer-forming cytoskeletal protein [Candidatus Xiphinematobacter sp.]
MNLNSLATDVKDPIHQTKKNILTSEVEIKGTLHFKGELIFDGKIEGEIVSEGDLILGKNSFIKGEVRVKAAIIHGTVMGNITVTEKCELKSSSQLTGDLVAARMQIEEGATFVGKSEVSPNKSRKPTEKSGKSVEKLAERSADLPRAIAANASHTTTRLAS